MSILTFCAHQATQPRHCRLLGLTIGVEVVGGGLEVGVAEKFLDRAYVHALADEVSGEGVTEFVDRAAVRQQRRPAFRPWAPGGSTAIRIASTRLVVCVSIASSAVCVSPMIFHLVETVRGAQEAAEPVRLAIRATAVCLARVSEWR